jgi:hypothetical protein
MANKMESWRQVVDLQARAFKPQGENFSLVFRGSVYTDGVGVSVVKCNQEMRAGGTRIQWTGPASRETYIDHLSEDELLDTIGRTILIDPNRRDLIYCMHEYSTVHEKQTFRWTKNNEAKITKERKLRKLAQDKKPIEVQEAEALLSELNKSSLTSDGYIHYLSHFVELAHIMLDHYGNCLTEAERPIPYHRKARLAATINKNKADDRLALELRNKFGQDAVLLMGDWSAPMQKYHEPIRGKGIRDALRHRGFEVLLLDEFRTSKVCPSCLQPSLKKFKRVTNPRTWRREEYPMVTCHGLLRCNNQECMQTVVGNHRYWNRDLASVLNYRHILNGLRANGLRPPVFQRPRLPQTNI